MVFCCPVLLFLYFVIIATLFFVASTLYSYSHSSSFLDFGGGNLCNCFAVGIFATVGVFFPAAIAISILLELAFVCALNV